MIDKLLVGFAYEGLIFGKDCDWCGYEPLTFVYPARHSNRVWLSGDTFAYTDKILEFCSPTCREVYLFYP